MDILIISLFILVLLLSGRVKYKSASQTEMRIYIRLCGIFIILWSFIWFFVHTYAIGGAVYNYMGIGLLISVIGIMMLKDWARYTAIIILFGMAISSLYEMFAWNQNDKIGRFTMDVLPVVLVIGFLLIPKVKEQFK